MKETEMHYPARVERTLVARVKKQLEADGLSWVALTRKLLRLYLKHGRELFGRGVVVPKKDAR